ncbi:MAG: hypothetical protein R3C56_38060 [Pirellulaceae bacterium]
MICSACYGVFLGAMPGLTATMGVCAVRADDVLVGACSMLAAIVTMVACAILRVTFRRRS